MKDLFILVAHLLTVLLKLVWLLRSRYGYSRALVASALDDLMELPRLCVADPSALTRLNWVPPIETAAGLAALLRGEASP